MAKAGSLQPVTYLQAKTVALQGTMQKSDWYSGNFLLLCAEKKQGMIQFLSWIKADGPGLN